jgi:hypothetical protein
MSSTVLSFVPPSLSTNQLDIDEILNLDLINLYVHLARR